MDFRWQLPARFNIGVDVADGREGLALIEIDPSGRAREFGFPEIAALSNRLANVLGAQGLARGERVAILLPHRTLGRIRGFPFTRLS